MIMIRRGIEGFGQDEPHFSIPEAAPDDESIETRPLLSLGSWQRYADRLDYGFSDVAKSLTRSLRQDSRGTTHEDEIHAANKLLLLMLAAKNGQVTGSLDPRSVLRTADLKREVAARMGFPDNTRAAEAVESAADGTEGMLYALKTLRRESKTEMGPTEDMYIGLNTALDGIYAVDAVQIIYDRGGEGDIARIRKVNLLQAKRGVIDEEDVAKIQSRHAEYARRLLSLSELSEKLRQSAEGRIMAELGAKLRRGDASVSEIAEPISIVMMEIEALIREWEQETAAAIAEGLDENESIVLDAETGETRKPLAEGIEPLTQARIDFDRISEVVGRSTIPAASLKILLRDPETRELLRDFYLDAVCIDDVDRAEHEEEFAVMVDWADSAKVTDAELSQAVVFDGVDEGHLAFYELNSVVVADRGSQIVKKRLILPGGGVIKSPVKH